ncbi:transposable element Tcb2 transposase [Trichonephila clavipes]|nr:transposable element Tcb2 transposase [Trichonephila clavipes]
MKALKFYKELKESEPSTSSRESEVASADEEAARKYPEKLAKIIKDGEYCAHQVFNADETGLFWKKCQPVLTLQKELLVDEALNDDDILESMVDITKDLETVDSEPEEDVTPLDEKLLREGLHFRQYQTTGTAIRGFSSGRPRGTTSADDRYIVLHARRNRQQTAGEIARHTTQATGRPISRFTVARRLHGGGLFARRPVRCVPLTPAHRRRRSLWCREHRNWRRENEWGRVLFTDESRFSLSSDSHRILIWREQGSRNHPSNIIERDKYGGRGVLVWGGIMLGSRTDLHIFDAGSVNGTRYCNEILLPYVRLFRGAMGLQFLFMDDNAPCHRTVAAQQLLESEDIERMDWPARSPDLNPIEHAWDFLGRRLAARTLPTVTIRELRLALQDKWAAMPQQVIDTLILSMGRRCETCLAVRGDHIPY